MPDGLDRLAADLDRVTATAFFGVRDATVKAAKRAETQARENASGHRTLPQYPARITSEVTTGRDQVTAHVGPERGGQGSLGHIIEHGGRHSRPHMHVHDAADDQVDSWVRDLASVAGRLL